MPAFDPGVAFVPTGAVQPPLRRALASAAVVVQREDQARFRLAGPGRVACLQGLVTCDVELPGDGSSAFGALLTAKGLVVTPLWITRLTDHVLVEVPAVAAEPVRQALTRMLPPRLCQWEDVTETTRSVGLYGPAAPQVLAAAAAGTAPAAGRAAVLALEGAALCAARVAARGVDGFDCAVPAAQAERIVQALERSGAAAGDAALLEERRILAGFPRLGAEIDERTLPQEVRLDELGAVSYTKGCYLGQETVARVHFRGHPNRKLVGAVLGLRPPAVPQEVRARPDLGRVLGRLSSVAWSEAVDAYVGLAVLRREVKEGATLSLADGSTAIVAALPLPGA